MIGLIIFTRCYGLPVSEQDFVAIVREPLVIPENDFVE
jgi:hypothetical protein